MKFVATVVNCVQVSCDDYKTCRDSKVFDYSQPFQDVIDWAKPLVKERPIINYIEISNLQEEGTEETK